MHDVEHFTDMGSDLRIMRDPVQLGVGFQHVQEGIHRPLRVHAVLREFLILKRPEVPAETLKVSAFIAHFLLYGMKQRHRKLKRFRVL